MPRYRQSSFDDPTHRTSPTERRRRLVVGLALVICSPFFVSTPGCSCQRGTATKKTQQEIDEAKKKLAQQKKEKPKPDFQFKQLMAMPHDGSPVQKLKPRHWVSVSKKIRANNRDFQGQASWKPLDKNNQPLSLDCTGYRISMSRPLFLSAKQKRSKEVEMTLFAPGQGHNANYAAELTQGGGRRLADKELFRHMEAHEYFMVVLAREPARYGFLARLDSIKPPTGDEIGVATTYYQVARPKIDRRVPIPPTVLTWTNTAYVLWDDLDPNLLSQQQQDALVDWIHWGGQLLVSGPDSLNSLKGSFLDEFLPVTAGKTMEFTSADFQLINDDWTEPYRNLRMRPLKAVQPWSGVQIEPVIGEVPITVLAATPDGKPLLVERTVGRGRIAVSAFRLRQRDLINWPGFDGFFNACLLRKPPRTFSSHGDFRETNVDWADSAKIKGMTKKPHRLDPRVNTRLRIFSRDAGYEFAIPREPTYDEYNRVIDAGDLNPMPTPGIGGWNDFSDVSAAARGTIRDAAGIEIPESSFVIQVLAIYLTVLVPLNWIVFRLIGRIEWAWVAAPVISVACAAMVIKLAQLDIGFARSRTDVAIVEMQGGYPRAHVTRYTALYTSLSTHYTVVMHDTGALVQPFAVRQDFELESGEVPPTVNFHRDKDVRMTGYHVLSNRTGLIHSEQIVDLEGAITLDDSSEKRPRINNGTLWLLSDAVVVRRLGKATDAGTTDGAGGDTQRYEMAWIGDIDANGNAGGEYVPVSRKDLAKQFIENRQSVTTDDPLNLARLVRVAITSGKMSQGDVRLVAVSRSAPITGITVTPSAPQARSAAVIVTHLRWGEEAKPKHDTNCRQDFAKKPLSVSGERPASEDDEDSDPNQN